MTRVLIGIPTLNGPDRLDRVLASIRQHTDLTDVTVLVSDDASTPNNLGHNKGMVHRHSVEMLMTEQRLGVSMQWNCLVRHVSDVEICVLLNDDVEVVDDWLDVLVFSLKENPDLGMVALRCETGIVKGDCPPRPRVDYNEAHLLVGGGTLVSSGGACFAFRRADWEAVGGFDERYFCFYEEVDFGVKLATERNLFSAFASYPVVYHMGGATTSQHADINDVLVRSREAFTQKWGTTLDALRRSLRERRRPDFLEWNSQWKYWRHP